MTCPAHLNAGPLPCDRTDPHATGHTYTASSTGDAHDVSEQLAEENR